MSDGVPFREFIFQEVCMHLTSKEVYQLAYIQDLPVPYLESKDGTKVLLQLETLDRFSASKLTPLAEMLKVIGRKDLARKVEKYHSHKTSRAKKQKHQKSKRDIPAVDQVHMLKRDQAEAGLKRTKLQVRMLTEQLEEVQATAKDLDNKGLEESVTDAITIIKQGLQQKLSTADTILSQQRPSRDSLGESSSQRSSTASSSSSEDGQERRQPVAMGMHTKTTKASRSKEKQPCGPPPIIEEHEYESVEPTSIIRPPPQGRSTLIPLISQDDSQGKMVTGRDGTGQRPTVAPKPPKKQMASIRSPEDQTADYTGGSADTSTGDSGFVDARKFLKDCPSPKVAPRHKYTPLKAEQRETAPSYAEPLPIKKAVYDEVTHSEEHPYVNIAYQGSKSN